MWILMIAFYVAFLIIAQKNGIIVHINRLNLQKGDDDSGKNTSVKTHYINDHPTDLDSNPWIK